MAHALFAWGSLLLCCGYAVSRGGWPERQVAIIQLVSVCVTPLFYGPLELRFADFEAGVFLVDASVAAFFLLIALRANRFWTLWLCAFQFSSLACQLLGLLEWSTLNLTTAILSQVWIYPELIVMVIGTFRHRERLGRTMSDRPWSHSWRALRQAMRETLRTS